MRIVSPDDPTLLMTDCGPSSGLYRVYECYSDDLIIVARGRIYTGYQNPAYGNMAWEACRTVLNRRDGIELSENTCGEIHLMWELIAEYDSRTDKLRVINGNCRAIGKHFLGI